MTLLVKTVTTSISSEHRKAFDAYLRKNNLEDFYILNTPKSSKILVQFYDEREYRRYESTKLEQSFKSLFAS